MALCLTIAIKNKASNDEIFSILKDVPNPNQDDDDGKIQVVSFDRLSTMLWSYQCVGSQTCVLFLVVVCLNLAVKYTIASFFVNI